jgi:hypothetical protein
VTRLRQLTPGLLCGLALMCGPLLPSGAGAGTATVAGATPGALRTAGWLATAYGEEIGGFACWIAAADTALRLEILVAQETPDRAAATIPDRRREALLARRGDGWTYARAGRRQPGLLNRWDDEWRAVSPDFSRLLQRVALKLEAGRAVDTAVTPAVDGEGGGLSRWRATGGERRARPVAERLAGEMWVAVPGDPTGDGTPGAAEAVWRRDLVARGRGRGGLAEAFVLTWTEPDGDGTAPQLVVSSVRRPGSVRLWLLTTEPIRYPDPETFLPLWPLAQILEY